ncbi:hypothetical protein E2C01_096893 [Portunus trituberculatus]|uniref:Uncharacterized protein n=1 Tax=Portunus trituberculatus TaxID=210409 RepID=A0A5B7K2Y7_PORTR|nr:hypothetical protein [Portunus trituberculatus]
MQSNERQEQGDWSLPSLSPCPSPSPSLLYLLSLLLLLFSFLLPILLLFPILIPIPFSSSSPPESRFGTAGIRHSVRRFSQTYAALTWRSRADGALGEGVMEGKGARYSVFAAAEIASTAYLPASLRSAFAILEP